MLIDLVLDLRCRVTHINARIRIRRAHFCLWALQGGEKFRVQEGGFRILELDSNITRQPEVGVLVDSAGDQARNVGSSAKDLRERIREGWRGLDRCEVDFADIVTG